MISPNSIVGNKNTHIQWQRTDCKKYTITNISPTGGNVEVSITNDEDPTYLEEQIIATGTSVDIALPDDGIYNFDATVTLTQEVFSDFLIEACALIDCYTKLLNELYCCGQETLVDPCETKLCPPADSNAAAVAVKKEKVRKALEQLSAMIIVLIVDHFNYYLSGVGLSATNTMEPLSVTNVKTAFTKINKFTKSCGFDCKEGSEGVTTDCLTC